MRDSGPIALHGGGEFLQGDEPFLRAILALAPTIDGVVRVAIVPTAAGRGRPDLAGAHGSEAFRRVAEGAATRPITVDIVLVVDAATAADQAMADRLARATLIHLPGGDPDIIPELYPGSPAWSAIQRAREGGAVLAGASAGAMALAGTTWTGRGTVRGLDLIPGIIVAPHADAGSWPRMHDRFGSAVPLDTGVLGLGERTAVIVPASPGEPWRVVGEHEVRWWSAAARRRGDEPIVARDGGVIGV